MVNIVHCAIAVVPENVENEADCVQGSTHPLEARWVGYPVGVGFPERGCAAVALSVPWNANNLRIVGVPGFGFRTS
jgi:hypothetical protein